jgi:hypothetical protein
MGSKGAKKETLYSLSRERADSDREFALYKKRMLGESHRSAAIMASAFVEHTLVDLLSAKFIRLSGEEFDDLFFSTRGVLSDFASRIDIAYALGLITKSDQKDLTVIRHVRNTFAHAMKDIDFSHKLIRKECFKFSSVLHRDGTPTDEEPREHYILVCHHLAHRFSEASIKLRPPSPPP